MLKKTDAIIINRFNISSSKKKGLCALMIFASMLINGFALSAGEVSRYSAVMIGVGTAAEMVSAIFGKCNESLVGISQKVSEYIREILTGAQEGVKGETGKKSQEGKCAGSGASDGKAVIKEVKRQEWKERVWGAEGNDITRQLYKLYERYKIPEGLREIIVIMGFIVYIIGIRHRKGLIGASLLYRVRKTKISA
ncbi:MAG: hypothetical protein LBQ47_00385 [Endomicrobium sp.]|jgi:hypothetical protein|nr:hypothetical protein [Endomicrobium sp.]